MQTDGGTAHATLIGFSAIALWGLLALFTALAGDIPPLQLTAMSFALGTCVGLVPLILNPKRLRHLRQPLPVWLLGVIGLFGYHFLYFSALQNAPPIEAGLIAYLWPLLIVMGSALLPGERLQWFHIAGAVLGAFGCAMIVTKGAILNGTFELQSQYGFGYILALACAFTWSGYSLVSRAFKAVPTDAVTGFCAMTAILAGIAHLVLETTVIPAQPVQWIAVLGLGLGPVGLAFYTWDIGVKRGSIQLLGVISYATPLLSTLVLIFAGQGEASLAIFGAAILISVGALLAASDRFRRSY